LAGSNPLPQTRQDGRGLASKPIRQRLHDWAWSALLLPHQRQYSCVVMFSNLLPAASLLQVFYQAASAGSSGNARDEGREREPRDQHAHAAAGDIVAGLFLAVPNDRHSSRAFGYVLP
jgi:hypothetical protein